ncbi:ferritin-like protein [Cupriavidus respiraculi]|uniref:Dichlorochromopyrrolate synthase n=1 Tax=Cupriavidus respiraculi TaxID=195930 RepID=A0ABM8WFR7_9BURK|nr:ferritin-like protein [Cupriavidus respiraculi]CAG9166175.1 Dichlorochromopyrrolate synthase [Cupriavidus respiraculi]
MKDTIASANDEPDVVIGGREQLFHLLAEAAEIEHTLMCCYLYAAFSLKSGDADGMSAEEAAAVKRWRQSILTVAVDEMVHMLLVANISIAIGGRPHFSRPNFPVSPGYFPADMVLKLAPFDTATLDHFVYLERPVGVALEDGAGFEPRRVYQREEAFHGLMPSIQDYETVGSLYEALRMNLQAVSARIGDARLFVGPTSCQVGRDAVDLDGVATIHDLASALAAIDTIVEQGEGSPADREDSHYQRFCSMRDEYHALRARNPSFEPAWPAAENPVMRKPPEPEGKVYVDDPQAARVMDFGNACYAMLLQCLVQAFGHTGTKPGEPENAQSRTLSAAIDLMHVLGRTASALARLPASAAHPGINAGLSFTMLRGVEPFFRGLPEAVLMAERMQELSDGASAVAAIAPELGDIGAKLGKLAGQFRS